MLLSAEQNVRPQYMKSPLIFSKDMAVVIYNHPSLLYHMTLIQLTYVFLSFTYNLATHIHHFIQGICAFHIQATKRAQKQKC